VTSVLLLLILLDQRRGVPESIPGVGTEALANGRQWVTSVSAHETKPGIFRVIAAEIQTKEANFVGNDKGAARGPAAPTVVKACKAGFRDMQNSLATPRQRS
jgi:hypothetical protein